MRKLNKKIKRIHNTRHSDLIFFSKRQIIDVKPKGLWYGVNEDWLRWCKSEQPNWIYPYNFELKINFSKIIVIKNYEQLKQFTEKYKDYDSFSMVDYQIDWYKVAKKYSGIEISPYIYEARFRVRWYYGWDCASGCVWKKDAIRKFIKYRK